MATLGVPNPMNSSQGASTPRGLENKLSSSFAAKPSSPTMVEQEQQNREQLQMFAHLEERKQDESEDEEEGPSQLAISPQVIEAEVQKQL